MLQVSLVWSVSGAKTPAAKAKSAYVDGVWGLFRGGWGEDGGLGCDGGSKVCPVAQVLLRTEALCCTESMWVPLL
jgi:hypothetical protein